MANAHDAENADRKRLRENSHDGSSSYSENDSDSNVEVYFQIKSPDEENVLYDIAIEAKQDGSFARLDKSDKSQQDVEAIFSQGFANCVGVYLTNGIKMSLAHFSSFSISGGDGDFLSEELKWISGRSTATIIINPECADGDEGLPQAEKDEIRERQSQYIKKIKKVLNDNGVKSESINIIETLPEFGNILIKRNGVIDKFEKYGGNIVASEIGFDSLLQAVSSTDSEEKDQTKKPKIYGNFTASVVNGNTSQVGFTSGH